MEIPQSDKAAFIDVVQGSRIGPSNFRSWAGVFGAFSGRMVAVFAVTSRSHRVASRRFGIRRRDLSMLSKKTGSFQQKSRCGTGT